MKVLTGCLVLIPVNTETLTLSTTEMLHCVLCSLFSLSVFFLFRLVGRSKVQQRKCSVSCAPLEAFQTHSTLRSAAHTPPARSSAVRLQPLALRLQTLPVGTVVLGEAHLSAC